MDCIHAPARACRCLDGLGEFVRDRGVRPGPDVARTPTGAAAVEFWREELARCYGGEEPLTREGRQLKPFVRSFDLPRKAFEDVIGRFELGLDEFSFGILYAVFGVGAVAGAMMMPTVNRLVGADRANIWAMGTTAAAILIAALAMTPLVVGIVVVVNGFCWMTVIANNGASVQMALPNFMRARGMAVHQMVFFGSMVVGSLMWGKIANLCSVQAALIASAVMLVPLTVLAASIRLPGTGVPRG